MSGYERVAVVFAGGKSSRMRSDKSLLPFGGFDTLSEFQYRRLSQIFDSVYLSTKSDKFDFDVDLIYDLYDSSSPLVGIISIFETLDIDECFILSVDAPFVDKSVIDRLYNMAKDGSCDAIIAQTSSGKQPLCGIYRRSILPICKRYLDEDRHRLTSLLDEVDSRYLLFTDEKLFSNLNYPQEYRDAKLFSQHYLDKIRSNYN